jgi:hypothetical protein
LFKVPDNANTTENSDKEFVKNFFQAIDSEDVTVEDVCRLGKAEAEKTRPIRIQLKDSTDKATVMGNLNKLKNAPEVLKEICVAHDLTPEQRAEKNAMIAEARNKIAEEGFRFVLRNGGGPRWDPKIVKIKINQQPGT